MITCLTLSQELKPQKKKKNVAQIGAEMSFSILILFKKCLLKQNC